MHVGAELNQAMIITLVALATALATGIGAIPLAVRRGVSSAALGSSNAVAAGLMLSAAAALLLEGIRSSVGSCVVGAAVGALMVAVVRSQLASHPVDRIGQLRGAGAQRGLLIMLVMTVHSLAEGIGIGVSFADGSELGIAIAIAMAVHNIPEGLAISLVLVPQGVPVSRAALWSIVSSLPQPLAALPAFLFVQHVSQLLPAGLGFAGGAMIALVAVDIIPEALATRGRAQIIWITTVAFVAMTAFQVLLRQ